VLIYCEEMKESSSVVSSSSETICRIDSVLPVSPLTSDDAGSTYCARWLSDTKYTKDLHLTKVVGTFEIVFEDKDIFVVEKPSYLSTTNTRTLVDSVKTRLEKRLGEDDDLHVVHRLDWETSGLMVFAKNKDAMRALTAQFEKRLVDKTYVADAIGTMPVFGSGGGVTDLPLSMDPVRRPLQRIDYGRKGKRSKTSWTVEKSRGRAFRLIMKPKSGRRHQLRVHCLGMGVTMAGDRLYERDDRFGDHPLRPTRLHLHATDLAFAHPVSGKRMHFHSDPPFTFEAAVRWAGVVCGEGNSKRAVETRATAERQVKMRKRKIDDSNSSRTAERVGDRP